MVEIIYEILVASTKSRNLKAWRDTRTLNWKWHGLLHNMGQYRRIQMIRSTEIEMLRVVTQVWQDLRLVQKQILVGQ